MNELDKKIREALSQQDAELFDEIGGEQSLLEMGIGIFHGRNRRWVFFSMFLTLAFTVLTFVCVVKFFSAENPTTRELIAWATGSIVCMLATAMLKLWFWMEMNKNAVTREVKRLELQIARLAKRLSE